MKTKVLITWISSLLLGAILVVPSIKMIRASYYLEHYTYEQCKQARPSLTYTQEEYEDVRAKFLKYKPLLLFTSILYPIIGLSLPWVLYWIVRVIYYLLN
jgi:hypothetical protein